MAKAYLEHFRGRSGMLLFSTLSLSPWEGTFPETGTPPPRYSTYSPMAMRLVYGGRPGVWGQKARTRSRRQEFAQGRGEDVEMWGRVEACQAGV